MTTTPSLEPKMLEARTATGYTAEQRPWRRRDAAFFQTSTASPNSYPHKLMLLIHLLIFCFCSQGIRAVTGLIHGLTNDADFIYIQHSGQNGARVVKYFVMSDIKVRKYVVNVDSLKQMHPFQTCGDE